jgi:uncharacterized membrane protein
MNLHPIFVHFPIALLVLYVLFEIGLPLKRSLYRMFRWENTVQYQWLMNPVWDSIKSFLVITGTVLAFPTLFTGENAEHIYMSVASSPEAFAQSSIGRLIEAHSTFAVLSVVLFSILAVGYVAEILISVFPQSRTIKTTCVWIVRILAQTPVRILLALVGMGALTITGALGGAISHGSDTDPVVKFVYSLFF